MFIYQCCSRGPWNALMFLHITNGLYIMQRLQRDDKHLMFTVVLGTSGSLCRGVDARCDWWFSTSIGSLTCIYNVSKVSAHKLRYMLMNYWCDFSSRRHMYKVFKFVCLIISLEFHVMVVIKHKCPKKKYGWLHSWIVASERVRAHRSIFCTDTMQFRCSNSRWH